MEHLQQERSRVPYAHFAIPKKAELSVDKLPLPRADEACGDNSGGASSSSSGSSINQSTTSLTSRDK